MANSSLKKLCGAPLFIAIAVLTCGLGGIDRTLIITSSPPGATILVDGRQQPAPTPATLKEMNWKKDSRVTIQVIKEGYAPQQRTLDFNEAKSLATASSVKIILEFDLVEIRREIPVLISASEEKATVFVDGKETGPTPSRPTLVFTRADAATEWNTIKLRVEKPPRFKTAERVIKLADAEAVRNSTDPRRLEFVLDEIQREIPVEISANQPGAQVSIDKQAVGVAPLKQILLFRRPDAKTNWPSIEVKIQKDGFEFRPPGTKAEPAFIRMITVDSAVVGKINADQFLPVRYVMVPLRKFEITNDKLQLARSNILSAVSLSEQGKAPTPITTVNAENAFAVSRLSVVPDQPDSIVYSVPKREIRSNTNAPEEVVGAILVMSTGHALRQLTTDSRNFDLDPFVTSDGRYIYFSSDRLNKRSIWRMFVTGRGGVTKITGDLSTIDTEPAVSPDGLKLAYTARVQGAAPNTPPQIWIANADGTLPTQMRTGRSPAWSPDGKKIAFVSPENKIWVMEADGGNQTQLTTGDSNDENPVWTPLGKQIIYASDQALNDENQRNYDIWVMTAEGSGHTQLTFNGSYDASPTVSPDGKYVYFLSNRGAQKSGQETLQIYRLELTTD